MSVYVDAAIHPYGRMKMCHMLADTQGELHAMAAKIGVKRKWFQDRPAGWHYDICQSKRELAVSLGAVEVDSRKLVELVRKQREMEVKPAHFRNKPCQSCGTPYTFRSETDEWFCKRCGAKQSA